MSVKEGAIMSILSLKALLGMPYTPVALPFKRFLIILVTCETEIGLNLNLQFSGVICPVGDSVSTVCIFLASLSPIETRSSLHF